MKVFLLVLAVVFTVGSCGWMSAHFVNDIVFDRNCGGYLKRAADANTIEMAREQLSIAVDYMQKEHLTEGYTSVLYTTPDEDVGFWYNNCLNALNELKTMKPDTAPLERSNMLMKLRETLLDNKSKGDSITIPSGIHIYPANVAYAIWGTLMMLFCIAAWVGWFIMYEFY